MSSIDYSSVIKVEYGNCSEGHYEIGTSNLRHLDSIISELNSAISDISGIPNSGMLNSILSPIPILMDKEKTRYQTFATAFKVFTDMVPAIDLHLKSKLQSLIEENYANKSNKEIKEFVKTYSQSGVQIELAFLIKELGLNIDDIADIIYVNDLVNSLDGMKKEDALALIQQQLKSAEGFNKKLLKSLYDSLAGSPITVIDNAKSIFESSFTLAIKNLTETVYKKAVSQAEIQSALNSINRLTSKLAIVDARIAANPHILPGGHTFARRTSIINALANQNEIYNNLSSTQKARIDTLAKHVGSGVTVAIVSLQLGVEGYKSRVLDGKDWEDTLEDIAVSGIGIGAGLAGGSLAGSGFTALLTYAGAGSVAGPIGMGVGFVAGVGIAVVYDLGVKDWVKEKVNELSDWWHEIWW